MNGNTKWILSLIALFIFIATGLGGYAVARVDVVEAKLTSEYVQKKDYRSDYNRIDSGITRLNDKLDELIREVK
jgi:uncharacterized membrane protein